MANQLHGRELVLAVEVAQRGADRVLGPLDLDELQRLSLDLQGEVDLLLLLGAQIPECRPLAPIVLDCVQVLVQAAGDEVLEAKPSSPRTRPVS